MKNTIVITALLFQFNILLALEPVEVADLMLKVPSLETQVLNYRFAAGDTIHVIAEPLGSQDISQITIKELPASVRFQDIKTRWVEKSISVPRTAVYSFELANNGLLNRTYRITIKRIPSTEEQVSFNTNIAIDTTYDTIPVEVVNTIKKIPAGSYTRIDVSLPEGTSYWVYWIGVGQEAAKGLSEMVKELPEAAVKLGIVDPVIGFALGFLPRLYTLNSGLDIRYAFERGSNQEVSDLLTYGARSGTFKEGPGTVTDYGRIDKPVNGNFSIFLDNTYSMITSKEVTVKVVAVKIVPDYEIIDE